MIFFLKTLGGTTHLFQPKNCSREVYIRNGGLCSDTEGQRVRDKCAMIRQLARVAMNLPDSVSQSASTSIMSMYMVWYGNSLFDTTYKYTHLNILPN